MNKRTFCLELDNEDIIYYYVSIQVNKDVEVYEMREQYKNFGDFLHQKRIAKGISYRELASVIGVSAPYVSDIEKDRRNAPAMDKLEKIAKYFNLSVEEKALMFDLAGEKKSEVAPDIPGYIKEHDYVASALRTARDLGASEKDWQEFVNELKKRKG